ncbi:MAG: hypothetical protein RLZZ283_303 [Candidatus Parcubacteria bacterium]|jgi:quinol-cytochrome oxidoreductase complex cytochrome b subunit
MSPFRNALIIVWSIGALVSGLGVAFIVLMPLILPCDAPSCELSLSSLPFFAFALVPFIVFVGGVIGGLRPERTRLNEILLYAPSVIVGIYILLYVFGAIL